MLLLGIVRGRTDIIVNSTVALAVTQLPALLERDLGIPMAPELVLWITAAVFLHVFGTVRFPGSPATPYQSLWWYDHLNPRALGVDRRRSGLCERSGGRRSPH
jgi:hypothetical protein